MGNEGRVRPCRSETLTEAADGLCAEELEAELVVSIESVRAPTKLDLEDSDAPPT